VTKNLKPASQCKKAARTAQTVLSQISRAFHYRDRHVFVRLYVKYVRPHLEFAVPSWCPWLESDKEVLEKVQRRAIKMVSGLQSKTYEDRLRELGLTTLEERRHQADMVQTYKIVTGKDLVNKETWFKSVTETGRPTRSAADPLNLRPQASRLEIRRHFFSQRVIEDWNKVPASLKQAKNVKCFKRGYRTLLEKMVERTQRRRDEEKRKAVWPTTIIRQSLSGSTGAMETHPPCIMYVCTPELARPR
jgi:ribonuclease P/MRP protein subunit RPP40